MYWKIEKRVLLITLGIYILSILVGFCIPLGLISDITLSEYENGFMKEIFVHNAFLFVISYVFGILTIGIYNILSAIANGITIGYIIHSALQTISLKKVIFNILPHGILEVPICLLGMSFGVFLIYINIIRWKNREPLDDNLKKDIVRYKGLEIVIGIFFLFISACVESYVMMNN